MPTIDNLVLEIESNSTQAESGLDSMAKALERLRTATSNQRGLNVVAKGIRAVADSTNALSMTGMQSLNEMTNALKNMGALNGLKISSSFASQIKAVGDATRSLVGVDWSQVGKLSTSLAPLSNINKATNLNNVVNALRKLPEAIDGVNKVDSSKITEFTHKVEALRVAVHPLADEMRAVSAGFSALPKNIQKAIQANAKLTESNRKTTKSFDSMVRKIFSVGASFYIIRRGFDLAMDAFRANNDYVESLNLSEITLGKNADAAQRYAEEVERLAGINQVEWLNNLGNLNQMFAGFGVGADRAAHMSQQLTQLAYDIQSAYNATDLTEVMRRIQSGITGEVEGMRRYGVELSNASMQEHLMKNGIDAKVSSLTMAQKAMVRYHMIMTRTANIQGDLARTIASPANALRMLSNQVAVAGRYFGQMVSVIAARVIPYVQAMVQVIAAAAQALASLWGYTLPKIGGGNNSISGGFNDVAESVGGVGGAAKDASKEVKGLLASFDEINIIQQETSKAGGGGGGGGAAAGLLDGLDWMGDYGYDFLDGINSRSHALIDKAKKFLKITGKIGASLAAWKIGNAVAEFFGSKNPMWGLFASTQVINVALVVDSVSDIIANGFSGKSVVEWFMGAAIGTFGGWKLTGSLATGLQLGFGVSLAATSVVLIKESFTRTNTNESVKFAILGALSAGMAAGVLTGSFATGLVVAPLVYIAARVVKAKLNEKEQAKQKFMDAFGDIKLTEQDMNDIALSVLGKDIMVDIKYTLSEFADVETMRASVNEYISQIKDYDYKLDIGLTLTKEESESYKTTVSSFVSDIESWITQNGQAVSMSLKLADLNTDSNDTLTAENIKYVQNLGKQAQEYLSQAFDSNGGLIDIDAYAEAQEVLAEIQKISEIVSQAQSQAKFDAIKMTYSGVEMTAETAGQVSEAIRGYLETEEANAKKLFEETAAGMIANINIAKSNLEADPNNVALKEALEKQESQYQAYLNSNPLELYMKDPKLRASEWAMNTWGEAFETLITDAFSTDFGMAVQDSVNDNIARFVSTSFDNVDTKQMEDATNMFVADMVGALKVGYESVPMDKDMAAWLANYVELGAYGAEDIIRRMRAGEDLGADVVNNLNDYMLAAAQAGNMDAIWYEVGKKLAESPEYLQLLATTDGMAETLNDSVKNGLLANLDVNNPEFGEAASTVQTLLKESIGQTKPEVDQNGVQTYKESFVPYVQAGSDFATEASAACLVTPPTPDLTFFNNGLNQMVSNAATASTSVGKILGNIGVPSYAGRAPFSGGSYVPKQYATGGFPTEGQLFIARESGAELVGQMGGKTAVANNDQIVQGISGGVAQANTGLERRVEQLIGVAEAILRKEFTAEVRPSAALGKTVKRSMELQARVGG